MESKWPQIRCTLDQEKCAFELGPARWYSLACLVLVTSTRCLAFYTRSWPCCPGDSWSWFRYLLRRHARNRNNIFILAILWYSQLIKRVKEGAVSDEHSHNSLPSIWSWTHAFDGNVFFSAFNTSSTVAQIECNSSSYVASSYSDATP